MYFHFHFILTNARTGSFVKQLHLHQISNYEIYFNSISKSTLLHAGGKVAKRERKTLVEKAGSESCTIKPFQSPLSFTCITLPLSFLLLKSSVRVPEPALLIEPRRPQKLQLR